MKSLSLNGLATTFIICSVLGITSCKKEQNTLAQILVVDTAGVKVEHAMVRLWPNPDPVLNQMVQADTVYTNAAGIATFDYTDDFNLGQAGFRVLDIEVRRGDTLYGEGIIKIMEEELNNETIIIYPI